jgi:hypothetical protein
MPLLFDFCRQASKRPNGMGWDGDDRSPPFLSGRHVPSPDSPCLGELGPDTAVGEDHHHHDQLLVSYILPDYVFVWPGSPGGILCTTLTIPSISRRPVPTTGHMSTASRASFLPFETGIVPMRVPWSRAALGLARRKSIPPLGSLRLGHLMSSST